MSSAGLVAFLLLLVAGAYALTRNGFDNELAGFLGVRSVTVDTWAEWCDHVSAVDLHRKYGAMNVSYEPDSIRADFVRAYLPIFAAETAGPIADDLVRTGKLRVWNDGATIHFVNTLAPDFPRWKQSVERRLAQDWSRLPSEEFFVNATLTSMFKEMILEDPKGQLDTIRLPFVFGK